ncbi:hypothetical protein NCER_100761 [Vairimorpha ceranae BRL01]|uniref:Uncharacterized protein n=1 Tax=Vairimorpha ceranae (strain BRL01) TaxID=578460 RepID=C4V8E7_VAIC1|nr:hypothetical protein NCER_100761 [Vairimorpha ceranae BRL01]
MRLVFFSELKVPEIMSKLLISSLPGISTNNRQFIIMSINNSSPKCLSNSSNVKSLLTTLLGPTMHNCSLRYLNPWVMTLFISFLMQYSIQYFNISEIDNLFSLLQDLGKTVYEIKSGILISIVNGKFNKSRKSLKGMHPKDSIFLFILTGYKYKKII